MLLLDKLDKLNFCKGLSMEYLRRLSAAAEVKAYQPRDRLFFEGQSSQEVYLLTDGEVVLETSLPGQDAMRLQTVGPGELLGWSPVLGLGVMTATARGHPLPRPGAERGPHSIPRRGRSEVCAGIHAAGGDHAGPPPQRDAAATGRSLPRQIARSFLIGVEASLRFLCPLRMAARRAPYLSWSAAGGPVAVCRPLDA